jgi:hypothetical protein
LAWGIFEGFLCSGFRIGATTDWAVAFAETGATVKTADKNSGGRSLKNFEAIDFNHTGENQIWVARVN